MFFFHSKITAEFPRLKNERNFTPQSFALLQAFSITASASFGNGKPTCIY